MDLTQAALIAGLVAAALGILEYVYRPLRWLWKRAKNKPQPEAAPEPAPEGTQAAASSEPPATPGPLGLGETIGDTSPPAAAARTVLVARGLMTAVGFKDREKELAEIGRLVDEGRGVIWVTGPAQSGKSWLESHFARSRGWQAKAARFELRGGADAQAVLEGVNRFLQGCNENRFDSWCRTANAAIADKAAALCQVLKGGGYAIVLDSFEDVAKDEDWADLVRVMQETMEGSWVFVGSRVRTHWTDRHAEVEVGPMEREAAEGLLEEAGAPSEGRDELFAAVGGLPGALELAGALAQDRGAKAVAEDVKGAAGEVGETLLAETFEAAGEGAQKLWTGLCLLPSPVTPATAEALCQRDDFGDAWRELVRRKLLDPGEERAELHPLARAIGETRLKEMEDWRQACGQRVAKHYAGFAEEKAEDRDAIEAELENVLAAARLAFQYEEWEALWGTGYALNTLLELAGRWMAREELLRLCLEGAERAGNKEERAAFTHNLGIALQQSGKLEEAEGLYRQGLEIKRELGDRAGEAQTLHQLGKVEQERGKPDEAEDLYRQSLEIEREVGDRPGEAATRHALAVIVRNQGKWEEAAAEFEVCLQLYRDFGMRLEEAMALHMKGMLALDRGKPDDAEDFYKQSLEIEREVGHRPGEAKTLHELGRVAQDRGKLEEAEGLYKQSLEIKREVGNRPGEAQTLHQLGIVACERGKLEEAEGFYKQSLEIEREVGNRPGIAISLHQLGIVAQLRGKLEEAEDLYRQSLEIEREVEDRPGEAKTLHQLGVVAQRGGQSEEAEELYRQSLEIDREVGDQRGVAQSLHWLGNVEYLRGKLEEAEDWYNQSLEIKRELKDRPGVATTLAQMALLAEKQGDVGLAVERMERAAAMMEEMGMGEAGKARGDLERLRKLREEEGS